MKIYTVSTFKDAKSIRPRLASSYLAINHPKNIWHDHKGYCRLQRSLRHQLTKFWNAEKIMFTHSFNGELCLLNIWSDLSNCPWRCISCHTPLYWNRSLCHRCVTNRVWKKKREAASRRSIFKQLEIFDDDYEMAYRAVKLMPDKGRVVVFHNRCTELEDCSHISQSLRRRGMRGFFCFSDKNITQITKKI